jgi:hypothetical protein
MLYYGDRAREVDAREVLAGVRSRLGGGRGALREAFLDAAALAQGLADAAFDTRGEDGPEPTADAALALTVALARRAWAAWEGRETGASGPRELEALEARSLPARVGVKEPEGYAHYAVYPEAHARAALTLPRDAPWLVIGVRSVGTGLGAMVAAALDAPLVTVRPTGHPFARALRLAPALRERLGRAVRAGARFAVADEGPGLSGSSFAAVAHALDEAGAPAGRVTFLPGHLGDPGAAAPEDWRARWRRADRRVAPFEDVVLPRLRAALAREVGATQLADVSAGQWREHVIRDRARWPPVFRQQERRKYLVRTGRSTWLARFAGLGRRGEETHARARVVSDSGLGAPPLGLVEGFLVQPWLEASTLLEASPGEAPLVVALARYFGSLVRAFPAGRSEGAGPGRLLEVLRVNAGEALGAEVASAAGRHETGAREAAALEPVLGDGKLERWEWLVDDAGRVVKTDALDHARGHDLAGAQPIAWDVAAAEVELGLSAGAAEELRARVTPEATPRAVAFLRAAYLAHRVGRWTFALATEGEPLERARIEGELARYRGLLRDAVS